MVTTVDHLNIRVGIVESEVEGEKAVTRYAVEQVRLNTDELTAFRAEARLRLDRMVGDMALVKAAQITQGGTLNILVQDVRELRTEMMAMRREMRTEFGELRTEVGQLRTEMNELRTEMNELRTEMNELRTEMSELRTEMSELRTEMSELRTEMRTEVHELRTEMNRRLSVIEQNLATLVAAVVPRNPA
jgi:predicted RNase H-like nuclease (RuvC/YqgF family)